MSSNVGLSTPRGSGTSGYVQRNLSVLKPRQAGAGAPYAPIDHDGHRGPPRARKPDQNILNHDRMREIEVQVLELRDRLEDEDDQNKRMDDDEIEEECERLRERLLRGGSDSTNGGAGGARRGGARDGIKKYQVHELAEAKIKESDRLRRALGLRSDEIGSDYQGGGSHRAGNNEGVVNGSTGANAADEHPMARQERRRREKEMARAKADLERDELQSSKLNERGDREYDRERESRGGPRHHRRHYQDDPLEER